jgi:hypothetical protein
MKEEKINSEREGGSGRLAFSEKIKPEWLETWEKESYREGWTDGRRRLIEEIDKRMTFIVMPRSRKFMGMWNGEWKELKEREGNRKPQVSYR